MNIFQLNIIFLRNSLKKIFFVLIPSKSHTYYLSISNHYLYMYFCVYRHLDFMFHLWLVALFSIKLLCISLIRWTKVTTCVPSVENWKCHKCCTVFRLHKTHGNLPYLFVHTSFCFKSNRKEFAESPFIPLKCLECGKASSHAIVVKFVMHCQSQLLYSRRKLIIYKQNFYSNYVVAFSIHTNNSYTCILLPLTVMHS